MQSAEQLKALTDGLRARAGRPLLVSTDEESRPGRRDARDRRRGTVSPAARPPVDARAGARVRRRRRRAPQGGGRRRRPRPAARPRRRTVPRDRRRPVVLRRTGTRGGVRAGFLRRPGRRGCHADGEALPGTGPLDDRHAQERGRGDRVGRRAAQQRPRAVPGGGRRRRAGRHAQPPRLRRPRRRPARDDVAQGLRAAARDGLPGRGHDRLGRHGRGQPAVGLPRGGRARRDRRGRRGPRDRRQPGRPDARRPRGRCRVRAGCRRRASTRRPRG